MPPFRYSMGHTRATNTMPLSIGAPQVSSGGRLAVVSVTRKTLRLLGVGR